MSKLTTTTPAFWKFTEEPVARDTINISFAEAQTCDHNIKAYADPAGCNENPVSPLFIEGEWLPIEHRTVRELRENGFGQRSLKRKVVERVHKFRFITDEYHRYWFYQLASIDEILKLDIDTSGAFTTYDAREIEIEEEPLFDDNPDLFLMTVLFKTDTEGLGTFGSNACCRPLYEGAPFEDPCDNGAPGDPVCEDLNVKVTRSGNILNTTITGNQGNGYQIQWTYKSPTGGWVVIANNASSVSLGDYGIYRATVLENDCSDVDEHAYNDPCLNFDVILRTENGNELVAEVTSGGAGLTYSWEYNDGLGWAALPDTGAAIVANDSGQYRVTVSNTAGCSDQDVQVVTIDEGCDWGLTIERDEDLLEAFPDDPALTYTYQWFVDRADGNGEIPLGTQKTQTNSGNGLYRVVATDNNGCSKPATYLWIECNTDCGNVQMLLKREFGQIEVILNPYPNDVEILWFLDPGDGTSNGFYQIGSGVNINITKNGLYKAVAKWGDGCKKEARILVYDCDTICGNFNVNLTNNNCTITAAATGGPGSPEYEWFEKVGGDWQTTGVTGDTFVPPNSGIYKVVATDGTCVAEQLFFISICDDDCTFEAGESGQYYVCS